MRRQVSLAKLSLTSLFLSASVALMAGCPPPPYPGCKKNVHCREDLGEACIDGTCQNCVDDTECVGKAPDGGDWMCIDNRCSDPSAPSDAPNFGAECFGPSDCVGGAVCTQGFCSKCTEDFECNGGTCDLALGVCTQGLGGSTCTNDDECAMDEICDLGSCVFGGTIPGVNPCGIDAIFFAFDSPTIDDDAQGKLDELAACLAEQSQQVYLEAHADPRGTEEYNIMLTDRRGQSVKNYLETQGVSGETMQVISKGNLEATGTSEAEWAQDRRVEFVFPEQ